MIIFIFSFRRILEDQKQSKRLFTPEIKRFLKSWLVRRRKNPYPNRSEKKDLALKTGLTYVQVSNAKKKTHPTGFRDIIRYYVLFCFFF